MLTQRLTDFATGQESLLTSELLLVQSPVLLGLVVLLLSYYGGLVSQPGSQAVLTTHRHRLSSSVSTPPGFVISDY